MGSYHLANPIYFRSYILLQDQIDLLLLLDLIGFDDLCFWGFFVLSGFVCEITWSMNWHMVLALASEMEPEPSLPPDELNGTLTRLADYALQLQPR